MEKKFRFIWALPVVAFLATGWVSGTAEAGVVFNVTTSFTPGSGYGVDPDELNNATLLDVTFAQATNNGVTLNNYGDSTLPLASGLVSFLEPNTSGTGMDITSDETDDLGVTMHFAITFTTPSGNKSLDFNLTGTANAGSLAAQGDHSDGSYTLSFPSPYTFDLGAIGGSGQLGISVGPTLYFNQANSWYAQNVDVTYSFIEPVKNDTTVPEPGSLVVWSLVAGIFGIGGLRRRRSRVAA